MVDESIIGSSGGTPCSDNNHDQSTSEKTIILLYLKHSVETLLYLNGGKEICTHIISLGGDLWDILKDDINMPVNGVGMLADRKTLTHALKKI